MNGATAQTALRLVPWLSASTGARRGWCAMVCDVCRSAGGARSAMAARAGRRPAAMKAVETNRWIWKVRGLDEILRWGGEIY